MRTESESIDRIRRIDVGGARRLLADGSLAAGASNTAVWHCPVGAGALAGAAVRLIRRGWTAGAGGTDWTAWAGRLALPCRSGSAAASASCECELGGQASSRRCAAGAVLTATRLAGRSWC